MQEKAEIKVLDLPEIDCDKEQIQILFYNIIKNALVFSEENNPVVGISSFVKDGKNVIAVKDNGCGVDDLLKDKIYDLFKSYSEDKNYLGSGAGLTICKKIVERHNGKIWFENNSNGKGSTFYVEI